jgi:hypothetical protein
VGNAIARAHKRLGAAHRDLATSPSQTQPTSSRLQEIAPSMYSIANVIAL